MRLDGFSFRTHNTRPTFQPPLFNSTGEIKALYVHAQSRTPLNYCTAAAVLGVSARIPMRLRRLDLPAAVDSPSTCDHLLIPSDVIDFFLSNSQHSAEFILPLHSIVPAKTEDVPNNKTPCKLITGICNDLVPRTARFPEKARLVVPRSERGKGRQPPSKARPRGRSGRWRPAKQGSREKAVEKHR